LSCLAVFGGRRVDTAQVRPRFRSVPARPAILLNDPQYFLLKRYEQFDRTLGKCVEELKRALRKLRLQERAFLSDLEMAAVGIAKLQQAVNQGAVGLIAARRKEDGLSGHILAVVPETASERARRDASGEVTAPLQSQAGVSNFRYGAGKANWWKGAEFAESAFWLHP
jgi:hypothetical protein